VRTPESVAYGGGFGSVGDFISQALGGF